MTARLPDDRWRRRALRARHLAEHHAAVAEPLRFYAALAELQERMLQRHREMVLNDAPAFRDRLDAEAAARALPEFTRDMAHRAPAPLAAGLPRLDRLDGPAWIASISTCWRTGGRESAGANAVESFVVESLLQPFAEHAAAAIQPTPRESFACPRCGGAAVVAALREQAHGARRSLVCGFCLHEWPSPRLVCAACGESRFEALPVFRTDFFRAIRLDACESCRTYVKTIDLTRDGEALPIVDDLASLPLDLWAGAEGYQRRPNLLRLATAIHD